jgi:hypothetical protein
MESRMRAVQPLRWLLEGRSDFVLKKFVRERALFAACDVPCAIT